MRVAFMGTPQYAVPVLERLMSLGGCQVVAVYTPPDRPRGRGREVECSPVKQAAMTMGLPVLQPQSFRSPEAQAELAALAPDVIVVAAYGRLLPPPVLEGPHHGCLNIHPSLLPKYRGPSPVVTAILDGAATTGVSLMLLDEGMDTGPIVAQQERPLTGQETAESLTQDLFRAGAELLVSSLAPWIAGALAATPQDDSQATVTRKLERADGAADWRLPAAELERRQRAFTPWPGLYTQWQGKSLRLLEVVGLDEPQGSTSPATGAPGVVVGLESGECPAGVTTGKGILGLRLVQLEGRRATSAEAFLRGYPDFIGSRLQESP